MANEFRHFILTGAEAYESLLAEMAGQDVEKAAKEYAVRTAVIVPGSFDTCEAIDAFKAGAAHGYARAKRELSPKYLISKTHADALVAEAVKAERERCAAIALEISKSHPGGFVAMGHDIADKIRNPQEGL